MEYFLYLCICEAVWICYNIAITESQASILVYLSLLVSNDNANDSVVGKSLGIVRGKIRFYKLIGFSAKPQNATNRNQRNNRKQGKCENVVFLNFCFCIVSRQDRILVSILIFRWLRNDKIDLRSFKQSRTKRRKTLLLYNSSPFQSLSKVPEPKKQTDQISFYRDTTPQQFFCIV